MSEGESLFKFINMLCTRHSVAVRFSNINRRCTCHPPAYPWRHCTVRTLTPEPLTNDRSEQKISSPSPFATMNLQGPPLPSRVLCFMCVLVCWKGLPFSNQICQKHKHKVCDKIFVTNSLLSEFFCAVSVLTTTKCVHLISRAEKRNNSWKSVI